MRTGNAAKLLNSAWHDAMRGSQTCKSGFLQAGQPCWLAASACELARTVREGVRFDGPIHLRNE